MPLSVPQLSLRLPIVFASVGLSIAAVLFFLPAASARITGASGAPWFAPVDSPLNAEAAFAVNDNGDAADLAVGNGICDTNAAAGDQCTLRAAIQESNALSGSDTITFGITGTINLASALPNLSTNVTISGPGSALLTVRRDTGGDYRIFSVQSTVAISGLTVTNGKSAATTSGHGADGGGISNTGTLTLTDVAVTANTTGAGSSNGAVGGQGGNGAGIFNSGSLVMSNCSVTNNTNGRGGNGITNGGVGGHGGGIFTSGPTTINNCSILGNTAGRGGDGSSGPANGGDGGGVFNSSGTLTMTGCTVTGNAGGESAGGGSTGGEGGGIYTEYGLFTLSNINLSNNKGGFGASGNSGPSLFGGHGGGLYIRNGVGTLTNSSVNNNQSGGSTGGSTGYAGGVDNGGVLTISGSTISGNDGGAGGILNRTALTMINSTVSNNLGAGITNDSSGILRLTNCTFTGNTLGVYAYGTPSVRNTIIARNGAGGNGPDTGGPFTSHGYNLIGNPGNSSGFNAAGDQVGTEVAPLNPFLGLLADNGGPTLTHALLDGSPAIDTGDGCVTTPAHCSDSNIPQITTDQRGSGFTRLADGPDVDTSPRTDIGAYERQALFPDLANTSGNEDTTVVLAFEVLDTGSITSITATSSNTTLVPNNPANINVSGSGTTRILTMNPAANQFGTSDITVTVNRTSGSASHTFTLTINPVNDAPSFTKGADQSVNENAGAQTLNNWATNVSAGPAESGQTVTFQVVANSNAALFSTTPAISPTGTLTFTPAAGVSGSATITFALMDNGGTNNGGIDTSASQTFIINVLEGGSLQFSSSSFGQSESVTSVVITVNRTGGTAGEARVDYATSAGTATAGQDYTEASGTLVFPTGSTSQTFSIVVNNDALDENTETVNLTLSNPAGTGALGSQATSQLSIFDNDNAPGLSINDVSVTEGNSGTIDAVFTVTATAESSLTMTANFTTANNSAVAPGDYAPTSGVVTFNPGDLTKTISVTVNGDTVAEVHETFNVNLNGATNSFLSDSQGVGAILSDDAAGGTLAFNTLHDNVNESAGFATVFVNRSGDTSAAIAVNYATSDGNASLVPCPTASGNASARCDFTTALGTLRFAAGDSSESFIVLINQDNFIEGPEILTLTLSNPTGGAVFETSAATVSGSLMIADDLTEPVTNPIDDAEAFVRQHYHDFLNREADASGLAFWKNEILSCGSNQQCIDVKRINVSAAFYLSIEFQETGYLVERIYKVSYGNALGTSTIGGSHQFPVPVIRLNEFLTDTQEIGLGLVVGPPGWQQVLENNKQLFADRFVQRARFTASNAFPTTMTASQFVDRLNTNAGGVLLPDERIQLINQLSTGAKTRAQVMRTVAEDSDLVIAERNRAFVLMQYFGYLRRNPNDSPDSNHTGYEFWLNKLNEFQGNFVNAEMVKAFITASEYRQRFGQ